MKIRFWPTLFVFVSIVALAAEEAPPAELLQNLDFYQNVNLVQDQQFFDMETQMQKAPPPLSTKGPPAVDSTTIHIGESADVSK
jgi:hypothetical protein